MRISKEKLIIIFYVLYFTWLMTIAYLIRNLLVVNYFSLIVIIFYFVLMREKGDVKWFTLAVILSLGFLWINSDGKLLSNFEADLSLIPLWLPLAWGTTALALRKFVLMIIYK